jgi:predicted HTH domain antitoxin
LELFREQEISIGRAAEFCAVPLATFMEFAAAHEVPPFNYGLAELQQDRQTIAQLQQ